MRVIYTAILAIYLTLGSTLTMSTQNPESFIGFGPSDGGQQFPEQEDTSQQDALQETRGKGSGKDFLASLKNLITTEGKTTTKTQNGLMVLDLLDYKNVRNRKELALPHLQVQKTSDLFTNNTDRAILHFAVTKNALKNKGSVNRATLKLTKMFDAKSIGFKCSSNSIKVYLIAPPEELKVDVIGDPIKMEFKKNEVEVDVTKFFDDLEGSGPGDGAPGKRALTASGGPGSMDASYIELNRDSDDGIEFDNDHSGDGERGGEEDEGDFFGTEGGKRPGESERDLPPGGSERLDKYLMLEADPNCYFAFDVQKSKPKVKLETTKRLVFKLKGSYKFSLIGVGAVAVVALGFLGYYLRRGKNNNLGLVDHQGAYEPFVQA